MEADVDVGNSFFSLKIIADFEEKHTKNIPEIFVLKKRTHGKNMDLFFFPHPKR